LVPTLFILLTLLFSLPYYFFSFSLLSTPHGRQDAVQAIPVRVELELLMTDGDSL
jgi:hypothetical protein